MPQARARFGRLSLPFFGALASHGQAVQQIIFGNRASNDRAIAIELSAIELRTFSIASITSIVHPLAKAVCNDFHGCNLAPPLFSGAVA